MAKRFTVVYPDDSKRNVGRRQKEKMFLAGELRQIDERHFAFIGEVLVVHSLKSLSSLLSRHAPNASQQPEPAFYPGMYVWQLREKRRRELMESPDHMALQLPKRIAEMTAA